MGIEGRMATSKSHEFLKQMKPYVKLEKVLSWSRGGGLVI